MSFKDKELVFVESESSKIGNLFLPNIILSKIKKSPVIEINAPINERVNFLIKDYSSYIKQKNSFLELFKYAENKVGRKVVKKWKTAYKNKKWHNLAEHLITEYYDPLYTHNLKSKNNKIIKKYCLNKLKNKNLNLFCKTLQEDLIKLIKF